MRCSPYCSYAQCLLQMGWQWCQEMPENDPNRTSFKHVIKIVWIQFSNTVCGFNFGKQISEVYTVVFPRCVSPPQQLLCVGRSHHTPAWPESLQRREELAPPLCASSPGGCGCSPRESACQPAAGRLLLLLRLNSPVSASTKIRFKFYHSKNFYLPIKPTFTNQPLWYPTM